MSDGGTGDGVSYWATINIRGELSKDQLRAVLKQVRQILGSKVSDGNPPQVQPDDGKPIEGVIVQAARLANTTDPQVSVTVKTAPNAAANE
jgi:hypothetical protein